MKKGIILGIICLLTLSGCGKIPTLENGEEAVITFAKDKEEHKISVNELYNELKNNYGLDATMNLIDTYIFEKEFADYKDEATKTASDYIKTYTDAYESEEKFLQALQESTKFSSIEAYQKSLYINLLQSHASEEYAKSLVKDKEVEKYYNDEVKDDVEVYQILITPDVKSDMSSSEKEEAEKKAKEDANDIIKALDGADNKLEKFKELVKKYSDDEESKAKDGNLGYINYNQLDEEYDELLDAVYKLKNGEYSKKVITTELGYHVIYRNASKDKKSLKDMTDEIKETLANQKLDDDKTLYVEALKYYREKYNMKIIDSELDKAYGIYMNSLYTSAEASNKSN